MDVWYDAMENRSPNGRPCHLIFRVLGCICQAKETIIIYYTVYTIDINASAGTHNLLGPFLAVRLPGSNFKPKLLEHIDAPW